ncbi:family 78 glycoside hydrolase catalytic domain [uncultured Trichococcus sp.]|uniref:alpha-L-rhamnosidase n=1 Tax=uncultured Trichococcus sp. TaxID=189665 RepID=UPI002A18A403|nr:family 78 glycoside hydrolase catalytic domain [uncultured Trichococcus sp.]
MKITDLKCNGEYNSLQPSLPLLFKWKIDSGYQKKYIFQISCDEKFDALLLNIETFSDKNSYTLTQFEFDEQVTYYYRVQVLDTENHLSSWSSVQYFEAPIKNWSARWISPENRDGNTMKRPFVATKDFRLEKKIKKARLNISSLGLYEAKINGSKVSDDYFRPGFTDYNHRVQFQVYDVSDCLNELNNIEITVAEGWYSGFYGWDQTKNKFGNRNAVIAELTIEYLDGSMASICTDETWKHCNSPIHYSDIYNGEKIDFRESNHELGKMVPITYPINRLVIQQGPSVQQIESVSAKRAWIDSDGSLVLDMGQNLVGWINIKLQGKKGQVITIKHAEFLKHDSIFYTDNLRQAEATDTYILSGNEDILEPHFTYHGFRYIKIEGLEENIPLTDVTAVVLSSAMKKTGTFETDNPKINRLQQNIEWSLKGNFFDIPTDCPQRDERLGWTGDAQIFAQSASFLVDTQTFFKKWLKDLALEQAEQHGAVPLVVPDILKGLFSEGMMNATAGWGDAATIIPWTLYQTFDDESILAEQYPSMKAWVNYIYSRGDNPYLWDTDIQLGDWLALDSAGPDSDPVFGGTDSSLIATVFYAESTRILADAAKLLGDAADHAFYTDVHQQILSNFKKHYLNEQSELVCNTQTANILALKFGMVSGAAKEKAVNNLVKLIKKENSHLNTGFLGTPYICEVLIENGHPELAYTLLFNEDYPSWLYQVNAGGTTIWERWNSVLEDKTMSPDGMNSLNHYAYGSIGDFLYQYVGGLRKLAPGYKRSLIYPVLPENLKIKKADCRLDTVYGLLANKWELLDKTFKMEVTIPANTRALIVLPKPADPEKLIASITLDYPELTLNPSTNKHVTLMGETFKLGRTESLEFNRLDDGVLVMDVPYGEYHFAYDI